MLVCAHPKKDVMHLNSRTKVIVGLLLVVFLCACSSGMTRDEWTAVKDKCRKESREIAARELGSGSDLEVEELYDQCIKEAQGRPQTLGDVRDRIKE